ncbi:hypothetical protein GY21_07195 [Cryobacterium roopkundense]|nr:DUF998 domain-containing protein [Cryobacterium roopkundense]KGJ77557.1 hypothetical protein GY21_07195 [Cryobacterium roopkundense]
MIGAAGYAVVDTVLQFLPPHYSPISDAESNLAVGPFGWIMNVNFLGRAVTSACAVGALAGLTGGGPLRRSGLVLFGFGGLCSAVLAFFPTDVHPDGEAGLVAHTAAGAVHLTVATVGFLAALAGITTLTGWLWRSGSLSGGRGAAVGFTAVGLAGLAFLGLTIVAAPGMLGLAERICLVGILGWVFFVCREIRGQSELNSR